MTYWLKPMIFHFLNYKRAYLGIFWLHSPKVPGQRSVFLNPKIPSVRFTCKAATLKKWQSYSPSKTGWLTLGTMTVWVKNIQKLWYEYHVFGWMNIRGVTDCPINWPVSCICILLYMCYVNIYMYIYVYICIYIYIYVQYTISNK